MTRPTGWQLAARYALPKVALLCAAATIAIGMQFVDEPPLTAIPQPFHPQEPAPSLESRQLVEKLEARGDRCGERPKLTDKIVFQYKDRTARVLGFDAAYAAGKRGAGWHVAYCA